MAVDRRRFVTDTWRAAYAVALLPLAGCARQNDARPDLPPKIPEYLDTRVPELLAETKVPGLSIAIVKDSALAWRTTSSAARASSDRARRSNGPAAIVGRAEERTAARRGRSRGLHRPRDGRSQSSVPTESRQMATGSRRALRREQRSRGPRAARLGCDQRD